MMEEKNTASAAAIEDCREALGQCRGEAARRIVGQTQLIDGILMAVIAGGHILLEGVPGLAKTLAVKTFSEIAALDFKRIQFTPDLLPADLIGTLIYEPSTGRFSPRKGPVFANLVLADEINRAPAKVQSALLEAMAEKQVTIGDTTWPLPSPFFVLATQNPIEQEGTFSLPEAELDRFLLKLTVPYPAPEEELEIVRNSGSPDRGPLKQLLNQQKLELFRETAESITCSDRIIEYIVSIVTATRPASQGPSLRGAAQPGRSVRKNEDILRYISFGASPRAGIALHRCAKISALFAGRTFVLPEDVKAVAHQVLRHRLVLSYEAGADGLTADELISRFLSLIPVP